MTGIYCDCQVLNATSTSLVKEPVTKKKCYKWFQFVQELFLWKYFFLLVCTLYTVLLMEYRDLEFNNVFPLNAKVFLLAENRFSSFSQ